jgi:hypothetical protein
MRTHPTRLNCMLALTSYHLGVATKIPEWDPGEARYKYTCECSWDQLWWVWDGNSDPERSKR